jgi:UDP-N-acetylglucosamine 2-epimerase
VSKTIVSIVGARPEFVQAMPISRALRPRYREVLVHTGQHYDDAMSAAFFRELNLPPADWNLDVGSGSHARQTAAMLERLEPVLLAERPAVVLVRGDTNSTVAGALAACKLGLPVAHVEAGERSFVLSQPEEAHRRVVDHLSSIHFCASRAAVDRLRLEGLGDSARWVGDVMLDAVRLMEPPATRLSTVLSRLSVTPGTYSLATVHRSVNTDDLARLAGVVQALNEVGEKVVFPVHPRTRRAMDAAKLSFAASVLAIEPAGYLDMWMLTRHARLVVTDSGGLQREAYYHGVPCLTLREETEWVETVDTGWNRLVGTDPRRILEAWSSTARPSERPPIYGVGHAADAVVAGIDAFLEAHGAA